MTILAPPITTGFVFSIAARPQSATQVEQSSLTSPTAQVVHELAPTGTLRVALSTTNETYIKKESTTGALIGVWPDLVRELVSRLGVPYSVVEYPNIGAAVTGLKTTEWDITFADRVNIIELGLERDIDATPPHSGTPWTFIVPAASSIQTTADVDRSGTRVAFPRSRPLKLERALMQATLVRTASTATGFALLKEGRADAVAGSLQQLLPLAASTSGYRVLADYPVTTEQAIAVRSGRPLALAYLRAFVEDIKASGFMRLLLDRWGLHEVKVAPRAVGG